MSLSTLIQAITSTPETTARRADGGYFGWTDRYATHASVFADHAPSRELSAPHPHHHLLLGTV